MCSGEQENPPFTAAAELKRRSQHPQRHCGRGNSVKAVPLPLKVTSKYLPIEGLGSCVGELGREFPSRVESRTWT